MTKIVTSHQPCPECGSSDALTVFTDGWKCFSCGIGGKDTDIPDKHEVRHAKDRQLTPISTNSVGIKDRGIEQAAVKRYRVTVNTNPDSVVGHCYPYFDANGTHVANKVRRKGEKAFYWEGQPNEVTLFGMNEFPPTKQRLTVVEGELDALSAYQMTGCRYPVLSVSSSSAALNEFKRCFEYLNTFEEIVIAFDNDEPGQRAAEACAQLFQIGKVRMLRLSKAKDASDYLVNGWTKEYINEWFRAPSYSPAGLKFGKDMWDEIINRPVLFSVPYPFASLNHHTYGMRLSELVVVTAPTGVGKTTFLKEIEHSLLTNSELKEKGYGVGLLHFEETNYDTVLGLMSVHNSKPYHLPDTDRTNDEIRKAFEEVIATERLVIWDHFGSNNVDEVLAKVRHMSALGCKYIVVDHLSIIVSDQSGDERKQLDEIATKLKMLCMELDIAVLCVIHQNRNGEIRGTAGVEQLANIVIKMFREIDDASPWRRSITKLVISKNRFCGRTGPAAYLFYNEITSRMEDMDVAAIQHYEEGGTGAGMECSF